MPAVPPMPATKIDFFHRDQLCALQRCCFLDYSSPLLAFVVEKIELHFFGGDFVPAGTGGHGPGAEVVLIPAVTLEPLCALKG